MVQFKHLKLNQGQYISLYKSIESSYIFLETFKLRYLLSIPYKNK